MRSEFPACPEFSAPDNMIGTGIHHGQTILHVTCDAGDAGMGVVNNPLVVWGMALQAVYGFLFLVVFLGCCTVAGETGNVPVHRKRVIRYHLFMALKT
jgi:hypothetical protein